MVENEKKQPIVECKIVRSKDGRFIIHRTIITDIKPIGYYDKVLAGEYKEEED